MTAPFVGSRRPLLTAQAFTPLRLPKLRVWLKASRIPGLVNDDPVTTWPDLSGRGFDATQGTAGSKPTFKTGILNGKPVVRFDGTDDFMAFAAQLITSQQFTIIAVANSTASGNREILSNHSPSNGVTSVFFGQDAGGTVLRFTDDFTSGGTWTTPTTHDVLAAVSEADNARTYLNGGLLASLGSALSTRTLAGHTYHLGKQGDAGEFWAGDVAELMVCDCDLNAFWMSEIAKYGRREYATP